MSRRKVTAGFKADLLLARAFFARLFESDLMPAGLPQVQVLIWGIAVFAGPGYLLSVLFAIRYERLWRWEREHLAGALFAGEFLFVTYAMMALGIVALIVWEGVFPDRRDVRVLGVLPVRTRSHVLGRLAALGAVAALFCIGVNLPTAIVYGSTLWAFEGASGLVRAIAAHQIATTLGGVFTFFLLIALQGVLLNLFGRRLAQKLALLLQTIFIVLLLQTLLFVPYLGSLVSAAFAGEEPGMARFIPSAWFLALYQMLAGTPGPVPPGYVLTAVGAALAAVLMTIVLLASSYRRLVRMAVETVDSGPRTTRAASAAVTRFLTSEPVSRAIASFTLRTLAHSRTHLMLLAMYVGVAAALVLSAIVPLVARRGVAVFERPDVALLSAPLVFNFFALLAMRILFAIPTEIKANWVFRLHAADGQMAAAIGGVRAVLLLVVVAPIALAAGVIGGALWGPRTGLLHAIFTGALGVLLADVALIGFRKIPFTCTHYPGRSRARTMWPFYLMALSLYAYTLAGLEAEVLTRPIWFVAVLGCVAAIVAGLNYVRRRDLTPPPGFTFEEEDPDALFQGFRLSEGVAGERQA